MNKLEKFVEFTLEKHIFPKCSQMFFSTENNKICKEYLSIAAKNTYLAKWLKTSLFLAI